MHVSLSLQVIQSNNETKRLTQCHRSQANHRNASESLQMVVHKIHKFHTEKFWCFGFFTYCINASQNSNQKDWMQTV